MEKEKRLGIRLNMIEFVNMYRERACLWDTRRQDYNKANTKTEALQDIGTRFGMTPVEVKRKIHAVRSTYNQMKLKMAIAESENKHYTPLLSWFKHATFLDDVITLRKSRDFAVRNEPAYKIVGQILNNGDEIQMKDDDSHSVEVDYREESISEGEELHYEVPIQEEVIFDEGNSTIKSQTPVPEKDEFATFSEYIASQLRRLPHVEALQLMMKIQDITLESRVRHQLNKTKF